jgi:hypothetical protein
MYDLWERDRELAPPLKYTPNLRDFAGALAATILWLGAALFDSFRDPAYCSLCDHV